MNEDEIKELIKAYIKENLYIGIETTSESYYESAAVCIKVYLEGEAIAEDNWKQFLKLLQAEVGKEVRSQFVVALEN